KRRCQGPAFPQQKSHQGPIVPSRGNHTEEGGERLRLQDRYELARELRERYVAAGRAGRSELISSYCLATGYDRKNAIKVLRGRQRKAIRRRGQLRRRLVARKMSQTKPGSLPVGRSRWWSGNGRSWMSQAS